MNEDGSPDFLHTPEWHGNPVSDAGSPVTMHWGTDIVEVIARATSGDRAEIVHCHDPSICVMGEFCEVIVARKAHG
jgi:hypothetical protein